MISKMLKMTEINNIKRLNIVLSNQKNILLNKSLPKNSKIGLDLIMGTTNNACRILTNITKGNL